MMDRPTKNAEHRGTKWRTAAGVAVAAWLIAGVAGAAGRTPRMMYACATVASQPSTHERRRATQRDAVHHLTPRYDRRTSTVLVRCVDVPTRASLDFAAWDRNAMRASSNVGQSVRPTVSGMGFGDALTPGSVVDDLSDTPLTACEQAHPMSWRPVVGYVSDWDYDEGSTLGEPGGLVEGETWGHATDTRPPQEISRLFLRAVGGRYEAWVEIEFKPWVASTPGVTDGDGDGYAEVYGRLDDRYVSEAAARRLVDDYAGRILSARAVRAWERDLVEEWYGPYYASALGPKAREVIPNVDTDPRLRAALGGVVLSNPAAAIRAEPGGKSMYTFLVVGCSQR